MEHLKWKERGMRHWSYWSVPLILNACMLSQGKCCHTRANVLVLWYLIKHPCLKLLWFVTSFNNVAEGLHIIKVCFYFVLSLFNSQTKNCAKLGIILLHELWKVKTLNSEWFYWSFYEFVPEELLSLDNEELKSYIHNLQESSRGITINVYFYFYFILLLRSYQDAWKYY